MMSRKFVKESNTFFCIRERSKYHFWSLSSNKNQAFSGVVFKKEFISQTGETGNRATSEIHQLFFNSFISRTD